MATKHAYVVALAGKGGTGKTTVAGLLVRFLKEHGMTPILAVDADANANLNEVLGLPVQETLGEVLARRRRLGDEKGQDRCKDSTVFHDGGLQTST